MTLAAMMLGTESLLGELKAGNEWFQFFEGLLILVAIVVVFLIVARFKS